MPAPHRVFQKRKSRNTDHIPEKTALGGERFAVVCYLLPSPGALRARKPAGAPRTVVRDPIRTDVDFSAGQKISGNFAMGDGQSVTVCRCNMVEPL